jgi:hypothetical protein
MKKLLTLLTLLPTLALADLGDSRQHPRRAYPRNWVVVQQYDDRGIAVKATYTLAENAQFQSFTDAEITEIFRRNGMPVGIWNYTGKLRGGSSDGVLYSADPRAGTPEMLGATLELVAGDLGVRSITVGSDNTSPTD